MKSCIFQGSLAALCAHSHLDVGDIPGLGPADFDVPKQSWQSSGEPTAAQSWASEHHVVVVVVYAEKKKQKLNTLETELYIAPCSPCITDQ